LLPAGMKITPYNHHRRLLSFPASSSSNKDYMGSNRAFALIQSVLRALCDGWESENAAPSGFDHAATTNQNSAGSIATRRFGFAKNSHFSRKERARNGAPGLGMFRFLYATFSF
jgi:hypothetical protein